MSQALTEEQLANLSDEEFMALDPSSLPMGEPQPEAPMGDAGEGEADAPTQEQPEAGDAGAGAEDDTDPQDETETPSPAAPEQPEQEGNPEPEGDPQAGKEDRKDTPAESKDTQQPATIDYKAEYERLLAPFKANGREMQIRNVDEAIQLMQMGANYNRKMAAMKPHLKVLKLLENHELLDEEKLSFLIDLSKKDKAAIMKLVKDSGIDPLDMDVTKESDYKPKPYTVDERQLALEEVLNDISQTPTANRLISEISNKWDARSKQILAEEPQVLQVLNIHMANGIYDQIIAEVERERMFGRLAGLSDIEAYKKVGDEMNARGAFATQVKQPASSAPTAAVQKTYDPGLKDKKRAAAPTSAQAPQSKQTSQDFNPLSLSDEEFMKQFNPRFL